MIFFTTVANANTLAIPPPSTLFGCEIDLPDNTMCGVSVASVALGATVIEKHFTPNRVDHGVDSMFSMVPIEMAQLGVKAKRAWQVLGQVSHGSTEAEKKPIQFRRSFYNSAIPHGRGCANARE